MPTSNMRSKRVGPKLSNATFSLDVCPCCGAALVLPVGPPDAIGLVVSEFPGEYELEQGRPFVPQAPAGRVFYHEMARAGLDADEFRITNVWLHAPNKQCLDWHVERLRKEMPGKMALLILGSTASQVIVEKGIMSISGLVLKKDAAKKFFRPLPHVVPSLIVAGPNPAAVLRGGVGELRLALSRFAQAYQKLRR